MGKVIKQELSVKLLTFSLALITGVVCLLIAASPAYAATYKSGSVDQAELSTQYNSFTTARTAPTWSPTNSLKSYEVYSTYLFFAIGADGNLTNYNMYMEICPAKSSWSKAKWYVFHNYVQSYTIKGLKANTKYKVRLYYGVNESLLGPPSKKVTFKTGPNKKPALKSVCIKATNYKRHKRTGYNYNFLYWWRHPYKYYTYTYKLKTTVTFKKVPKAKYVLIKYTNVGLEYHKILKIKKGKKTYTVSKRMPETIYNPRKSKSTVSVATYRNKTWKGYSKLWQKKRKIH